MGGIPALPFAVAEGPATTTANGVAASRAPVIKAQAAEASLGGGAGGCAATMQGVVVVGGWGAMQRHGHRKAKSHGEQAAGWAERSPRGRDRRIPSTNPDCTHGPDPRLTARGIGGGSAASRARSTVGAGSPTGAPLPTLSTITKKI